MAASCALLDASHEHHHSHSPLLRAGSPSSPSSASADEQQRRRRTSGGKRRRSGSDDEATFLLEEEESSRLRAAIDGSPLTRDMRRRLGRSLQETCADLDVRCSPEGEADYAQARRRTSSELNDFVRSRETTPALGPLASPALCASLPPALPPSASSPSPGLPPAASPSVVPAAVPAGDFQPVPEFTLDGYDEEASLQAALDASKLDASQLYAHDGLLDHEQLMQAVYASQGLDYGLVQAKAQQFLEDLGLRPHDMGVTNVDEEGNSMVNQCFYLSLARGYLGSDASWPDVSELALRLKRDIEAAVLTARPGWVAGETGCEAMAFADFLPLAMQTANEDQAAPNFLAELAVCIFDTAAGHVEVYLGKRYAALEVREARELNLVLLWYTPGHYQCLVNRDEIGTKPALTYDEFKDVLSANGVTYIETLE